MYKGLKEWYLKNQRMLWVFELFETGQNSLDVDIATNKDYYSHKNEEMVSPICHIFSTI